MKQAEFEIHQRMRSIYPLRNKLASRNMYRQSNAFSEPDEYSRRRQHDLLSGRTLGLTDSGILYEKAMALKHATGIRTASLSSNSVSSALNSSFIKSPRLPQPVKRPDSNANLSSASPTTSPSSRSIGNDWPFAFQKNDSSSYGPTTSARSSLADSSSTNSTLGGHSSSSGSDVLSEWSPLLAPKSHQQEQENDRAAIFDSKWTPACKKVESYTDLDSVPPGTTRPILPTIDTIHPSFFKQPLQLQKQEDQQKTSEDLLNMSIPDDPKPTLSMMDINMDVLTHANTNAHPKLTPILPVKYSRRMSNSTPTGHRYSPLLSPLPSPKSLSRSSNRSTSPPFRAWPPSPAANSKSNYSKFLNLHDGVNIPEYMSDHSDGSGSSQAEPGHLTEAAMNRRRRASAARAAKDKIAAETVDFDLMQDVQAWLRTLRLHKYADAFEGLTWQQVVRMTDEDMEQAGVNTIGARRKLLKVFENVMNHCEQNVSCLVPRSYAHLLFSCSDILFLVKQDIQY